MLRRQSGSITGQGCAANPVPLACQKPRQRRVRRRASLPDAERPGGSSSGSDDDDKVWGQSKCPRCPPPTPVVSPAAQGGYSSIPSGMADLPWVILECPIGFQASSAYFLCGVVGRCCAKTGGRGNNRLINSALVFQAFFIDSVECTYSRVSRWSFPVAPKSLRQRLLLPPQGRSEGRPRGRCFILDTRTPRGARPRFWRGNWH